MKKQFFPFLIILVGMFFWYMSSFSGQAGYIQNDNTGVFHIDLEDDLAGIDIQYIFNIDHVPTGSGTVMLGTGTGPGYVTTAMVTPASMEGRGEVEIIYSGTAPTVELLDCSTPPNAVTAPPALLGELALTAGTVDISALDHVAYPCLQTQINIPDATTVIDDIFIRWDAEPVADIQLMGTTSLVAGQCEVYDVQWSMSYVDDTDVVLYVSPVPVADNTHISGFTPAYTQFDGGADDHFPLLSGISHGGQYTAVPTTIGAASIPADSVYWNVTNVDLGSSYVYSFKLCTSRGGEDNISYQLSGAIVADDATLAVGNSITTTVSATPEAELFFTANKAIILDDATNKVVDYRFVAGNGERRDIATEDIFNPAITLDFADASTPINGTTCPSTAAMPFQDRVTLPLGFDWTGPTTAVRSTTIADVPANYLDVQMPYYFSYTGTYSVNYTGCTLPSTTFEVDISFAGDNITTLNDDAEVTIVANAGGSSGPSGGVGGSSCGFDGRTIWSETTQYNKITSNVGTYGGEVLVNFYSPWVNNYGRGRMYNNLSFWRVPEGYEVLGAYNYGSVRKNSIEHFGGIIQPSGIAQHAWNLVHFVNASLRVGLTFEPDGDNVLQKYFPYQYTYAEIAMNLWRDRVDRVGVSSSFPTIDVDPMFDEATMENEIKVFYTNTTGGALNSPPAYDTSSMYPIVSGHAGVGMGAGWSTTPSSDAGWIAIFERCIETIEYGEDPGSVCYGKNTWPVYAVVFRQKEQTSCSALPASDIGHYTVGHARSTATTASDSSYTTGVFEHHLQGYSCPRSVTPGPSELILPDASSSIAGDDTFDCSEAGGAGNRYEVSFYSDPVNPTMTNNAIQIQLPSVTLNGVVTYPSIVSYGGTGVTVPVDGSGSVVVVGGNIDVQVPTHNRGETVSVYLDLVWPAGFEHNTQQIINAVYSDTTNFCAAESVTLSKLVTLTCEFGNPEIRTRKYLNDDVIPTQGSVSYVITAQNIGEEPSADTFLIDSLASGVTLSGVLTEGSYTAGDYFGTTPALGGTGFYCPGCEVYFSDDASLAAPTPDQQYSVVSVGGGTATFSVGGPSYNFTLGSDTAGFWTSPFGTSTRHVAIRIDDTNDILEPGPMRNVGMIVDNSTYAGGDIFENEVATISSSLLQNISNKVETTIISQGICGHVFIDEDFSAGYIGTGDTPLTGGVTVYLSGTSSTGASIMLNTPLDMMGEYCFDDIPSGVYEVYYTETTPYYPFDAEPGSLGGSVDGNQRIHSVSVPSGYYGTYYDFGLVDVVCSIDGYVYTDSDGNRTIGGGDVGQVGVDMSLSASGSVIATTMTTTGGYYSFANLGCFIDYEVSYDPSTATGSSDSAQDEGGIVQSSLPTGSVIASAVPQTEFDISTGDYTSLSNNFGLIYQEICGHVFIDTDYSEGYLGTGDIPLTGNVTVYLSGTSSTGATVMLNMSIDMMGEYCFEDIPTGVYEVYYTETTPYYPFDAEPGSEGGTTNGLQSIQTVSISTGTLATDYDFGLVDAVCTIDGVVYTDTDYDQLYTDGTDQPQSGVTVSLSTLSGGSVDALVGTASTSATGYYLFDLLNCFEDYHVSYLSGTAFGVPDSAQDEGGIDQSALPANSVIESIVPQTEFNVPGLDRESRMNNFGLVQACAIDGYVYFDLDENQDFAGPDDLPVSGRKVTVSATDSGGGTTNIFGDALSTEINIYNGYYLLEGLRCDEEYSVTYTTASLRSYDPDSAQHEQSIQQSGPQTIIVPATSLDTLYGSVGFISPDNNFGLIPSDTADGGGGGGDLPEKVCGDGIVNQSSEACDDGNKVDGDGCSKDCDIEEVVPVCGDAEVNGEEMCESDSDCEEDRVCTSCICEIIPEKPVEEEKEDPTDDKDIMDEEVKNTIKEQLLLRQENTVNSAWEDLTLPTQLQPTGADIN